MTTRSIKSFFSPTSASATSITKNSSVRKTQLRIESDSDEEDVKENIPSQSKEKSDSNAKVDDNSANSDPAKSKCDYSNTVDDPADIRQTDLNLPVPYRKTARKSFKSKSDVEKLQEKKIKALEAEEIFAKSSSLIVKKEESNETEECDSVKEVKSTGISSSKSKETIKLNSKRSRIVSDSEEDSPKKNTESKAKSTEKKPEAKEKMKNESPGKKRKSVNNGPNVKKIKTDSSPEKTEEKKSTEATKTFSIFNIKKSPVKKETIEKSVEHNLKDKVSESTGDETKLKDTPEPEATEKMRSSQSKPKNVFQGFFSNKKGADSEAGDDYDKKVKKSQYHPVNDCFWKRGEKTPFLALAKTLVAIEETSGRLRTIEILSNYFRSVVTQTPEDLLPSVYLILNRLAPAWEGIELGVGEHLLMKCLANTTGRSLAQIKLDLKSLGDMGLVAENSKSSQRTMIKPTALTVSSAFTRLREIAMMTGNSSGNKKVDKIQSLLVACKSCEARYLIRSLAGKLRIGLAEQSVLQALAQACVQTPIGQDSYPPTVHTAYKSAETDTFKEKLSAEAFKLKSAYCECPSYDIVIPALLQMGIDGLADSCKLTPGIPLKPMLAHPTKGVEEVLTRFENCQFTCEWKYDGERAQIHLHPDGKITIYSRNQEDNTTKYPDIIARFQACLTPSVKSAILDSEAVAWNREEKTIQPFQVLSTRKRKDAVESEIKVQVCLFGFDLLYLNGESLVKRPFEERRRLLRENLREVEGEFQYAKSIDGTKTEEIQEALEESIKDNCEGLMVKTLDKEATYEIARRSHNWLKLKKDYLDGVGDTMDLVVIGGYLGKGKRTGGYGGFLLACYDQENEEYQTICKIGTGFSDEDLQKHATFFKEHLIPEAKSYYSYDSSHSPDHWFEPVQVWEVKCADLSVSPVHKAAIGKIDPCKGVSLRFPRFIRIRDDKNADDASSAEQIANMYNNQDQIKNQNKGKAFSKEDAFDF